VIRFDGRKTRQTLFGSLSHREEVSTGREEEKKEDSERREKKESVSEPLSKMGGEGGGGLSNSQEKRKVRRISVGEKEGGEKHVSGASFT